MPKKITKVKAVRKSVPRKKVPVKNNYSAEEDCLLYGASTMFLSAVLFFLGFGFLGYNFILLSL